MFGVFKEKVVFCTSRMNYMVGLFGNIGFVRRTDKIISTSAKFINGVVFKG